MTIRELIKFAIKKLSTSASPALDGEVLLSHVLDKPKEYLLSNPNQAVGPGQEKQFKILLNRRQLGWPVAHLTKTKEFYGLKFYVDKNVLIPRPETEGIVDLVLSKIKGQRSLSILDVGTGSGNIIISLAKKLSSNSRELENKNQYYASDVSLAALKIAKKNARRHKTRISFKQSDLLKNWKNQKFDIIIANLPYLAKRTDPSTKFEPTNALIAPNKGLALIEQIFKQLSTLSPAPCTLFLEIGHDQGPQIKKLAKKYLPAFETKIFKDLMGRPRFALLEKKSS